MAFSEVGSLYGHKIFAKVPDITPKPNNIQMTRIGHLFQLNGFPSPPYQKSKNLSPKKTPWTFLPIHWPELHHTGMAKSVAGRRSATWGKMWAKKTEVENDHGHTQLWWKYLTHTGKLEGESLLFPDFGKEPSQVSGVGAKASVDSRSVVSLPLPCRKTTTSVCCHDGRRVSNLQEHWSEESLEPGIGGTNPNLVSRRT